MDIITNNDNGTIIISDTYDILASTQSVNATPQFNSPGDEYVISFTNLQNVKEFTKFTYDSLGLNDERYLLQYYRISTDGLAWSDWLDLNRDIDNFPEIDPLDPLYIDIKWVRVGESTIGTIKLLEYKLEGLILRDTIKDGVFFTLSPGESKIIKPTDIYKVFRIDDLEIISTPDEFPEGVNLFWRYSQDSTRTWSEWEPLTKENITTERINPIRFFQIEYKIENNSNSSIGIDDINLIGDFQNVTKDYFKTNLFGIREGAKSSQLGYFDPDGNFIPNDNMGADKCSTDGPFSDLTDQDKANLYNPYAQGAAYNLLEKLSADSEQIFGHKVKYFATDADKKGQDHTLNEYQLYNVVCSGDIKVSIDGNNFPDSQVKMNIFDLDLFETMEAHITKKQFKEIFGPQRRPSKEDFLFFCDVNRMFQVDHAQQFRAFNNQAVYYKLILKKYTQKANVKADNIKIKNEIDMLTKNTTIDELFGVEQTKDKAGIANKKEQAPLTRDQIRLDIFAEIDKELIENSTTIISKSHYDLSSVAYREVAVSYKNLDPVFKVSDNVGFFTWFNINNYIPGEIYNFFKFYDDNNSLGWKVDLEADKIRVNMNSDIYEFELNNTFDNTALEEEVWYCYVLNINQRQRKLEHFIYKRNVEFEEDAPNLSSNKLLEVYKFEQDMTPISFQLETGPVILASDMKLTNVRLFLDVIPEDVHNKVLNQYIIGDDSKYLVFGDNATTRLTLPFFPYNE
jgi:hypothetical protein